MYRLRKTQETIRTWALLVDGVAAQDGCGQARTSCDCTFWNGLFCSSGGSDTAVFACPALSRSQSSDGMLWRSPWNVHETNATHSQAAAAANAGIGNPNWFSRDQGLATLAALTHTKNATLYNAWLRYIQTHNASMCPGKFDCLLTPPFWCTFDKVTRFAGLTPPSPDLMTPRLGAGFCNNDHGVILVSVYVNANGTALHLAAVDVMIRRLVGDWDGVMQAAAEHLAARMPNNIFLFSQQHLAHLDSPF